MTEIKVMVYLAGLMVIWLGMILTFNVRGYMYLSRLIGWIAVWTALMMIWGMI